MNTVQLADFCSFTQGGKQKLSGKDFVPTGYPAYGAGGLNGYLPEAEFDKDAVVLSAIGARCGKCFLATGEWASLANTQVIFPDPSQADVRFLWYQLNDEGRWPRHGLAQPFIRPSDVKAHQVCLPPLEEQRRIAAILDKADALRQKRKHAIALLESLTQSMFVEMFDGTASPTYDTATLSEVTNQITDGAHFTPTYVDEGVPFLRVTDIHAGPIDWRSVKCIPAIEHQELIKRCKPEVGDILLSKNGTIGVPRIVDWTEEFSIFVSLALLKPRRDIVSTSYLFAFLQSPLAEQQLRQHSKTGTVTNLHLVDIRKLRLPLPPLEKQHDWETTAGRLSAAAGRLAASFNTANALFASLQHRAFSGQL